MQETQVQSLGREDPLEEETATHSSTLAWRIPWTEESGRATVHGVARVGQDLAHMPVFQMCHHWPLCSSDVNIIF